MGTIWIFFVVVVVEKKHKHDTIEDMPRFERYQK